MQYNTDKITLDIHINEDFRLGRTTIENAIQIIEQIFEENKEKYCDIMFERRHEYEYDLVFVVGTRLETDEEHQQRVAGHEYHNEQSKLKEKRYERYMELKKKFGEI
jgi:2,3-bisphosphoglycerate-independent phosphoglycerate mutase